MKIVQTFWTAGKSPLEDSYGWLNSPTHLKERGTFYNKGTMEALRPSLTHIPDFLQNELDAYPIGSYNLGVFRGNDSSATVNLPTNTVARLDFDQMPKYGYKNYSTLERGVVYSQSSSPTGSVFQIYTYSIYM